MPAHNTLYSTPDINLPIMIGSAALAAPALWWATRPARGPIERAIGVFVGIALDTVSFSALGIYMIYGFSALLANLDDQGNLYVRFGWDSHSLQGSVFQLLTLPAAILIVGGIAVALAGSAF